MPEDKGAATGEERGKPRPWQAESSILPAPQPGLIRALELLPKALAVARPLKRAHRDSLPRDIRDLSRLLTSQRGELRQPYWSRPGLVSAYLYYFLPWNLLRLARLFAGLPLPGPAGEAPLLLDAGSGPLTLPIALWLARPEWRKAPIRVVALDSSPQPLELGVRLFSALAELLDGRAWQVELMRGPAEKLAEAGEKGDPWLISAANLLNELKGHSGRRKGGDVDGEWEESGEEGPARLLYAWRPLLKNASLFFVEPGTRLGAGAIMNLRLAAIGMGLFPLSPCGHAAKCPLLEKGGARSSLPGSWCHFTFAADGAPAWLKNLSRLSGLGKSSLTLSPLLLKAGATGEKREGARLISHAFHVPGLAGKARYACREKGLALLENAGPALMGSFVITAQSRQAGKDHKSGAPVLRAPEAAGVFARRKSPGRTGAKEDKSHDSPERVL